MGIACAQQDLTRVYPLADDPERCVEDFLELAAEHARALAERLEHQEASVERFLELQQTRLSQSAAASVAAAVRRLRRRYIVLIAVAVVAVPGRSARCSPARSASTAPSARRSPRWSGPRRAATQPR